MRFSGLYEIASPEMCCLEMTAGPNVGVAQRRILEALAQLGLILDNTLN